MTATKTTAIDRDQLPDLVSDVIGSATMDRKNPVVFDSRDEDGDAFVDHYRIEYHGGNFDLVIGVSGMISISIFSNEWRDDQIFIRPTDDDGFLMERPKRLIRTDDKRTMVAADLVHRVANGIALELL
jgi:hypothetical protein